MPTREYQPRGRKVERQPQHGRDQQHRSGRLRIQAACE
jgi:hypothetical protein